MLLITLLDTHIRVAGLTVSAYHPFVRAYISDTSTIGVTQFPAWLMECTGYAGGTDTELPELPPETDDGTCINHVDANDDGRCDRCAIVVTIELNIYAVNDLHGKFADSDTQPGVDELTTFLKRAYQDNEHVILLSSGDMWQGSSESNLTKGQIITDWMNDLDVVSMTLGNHEYDWGEEFIAQNAAMAEFPFLAINIYDADTDQQAEYCQSSVIVERGGAQIGIIGAIGDCYSSISKEVSGGFYFKTGSVLTELVKAEAKKLRENGADFIVYSVHDGHGSSSSSAGNISDSQLRGYYDPVLSDGYVDIVFEGHSHKNYVLKDSEGVYHLQGGGDNRGLCHAEAVINFANRVLESDFTVIGCCGCTCEMFDHSTVRQANTTNGKIAQETLQRKVVVDDVASNLYNFKFCHNFYRNMFFVLF